MKVDGRADADRNAVGSRQQRLVEDRDLVEEGLDIAGLVLAFRHGQEVGNVVAGGKTAGDTEQDHGPDGVVVIGAGECHGHGAIHVARDRILLRRPVHADDENAGMGLKAFERDVLSHGCP